VVSRQPRENARKLISVFPWVSIFWFYRNVPGSSLTVPPACLLPFKAKKVIICNLQKTDYDGEATIRVFFTCDDFMHLLLERLDFLK
jgi:hypothetical protein